ncbi:MAG: hypothetical protein ACREDR_11565 [Blastocatellia bacterium]
MTDAFKAVLEQARKLPLSERQELATLIIGEISEPTSDPDAETIAALSIVEQTFGSIKGIDRDTLIRLAEDEEFCGY